MRTTPVIGATTSSDQRSKSIRGCAAASPKESLFVSRPLPAISTGRFSALKSGVLRMRASSPQLEQAGQTLSLRELELEARTLLDPVVYDFVAGGAEDEITLRANDAAFARIRLVPRVLSGKRTADLGISLLGRPAAMPVLIAPTAFHRLAHPEGECATARAAAAAGVIMIVSMASTVAIDEV